MALTWRRVERCATCRRPAATEAETQANIEEAEMLPYGDPGPWHGDLCYDPKWCTISPKNGRHIRKLARRYGMTARP